MIEFESARGNFWRTLRLLLFASMKRSAGRRHRQQEWLSNRAGRSAVDWSWLAFAGSLAFMALVNGGYAFVVDLAVSAGQVIDARNRGVLVVSRSFMDDVVQDETEKHGRAQLPESRYAEEANALAKRTGQSAIVFEHRLRQAVESGGSDAIVTSNRVAPGLGPHLVPTRTAAMLGSAVLLWWLLAMVFQGEGLELDTGRRRHVMWEWLLSHPVPPAAVFAAEMLSPVASNAAYLTAPFFVGTLYGLIYGWDLGFAAAFVCGVPIAVAAACVGKMLEIVVLLRAAPRARGAFIALMGWVGQTTFLGFYFLAIVGYELIERAATLLEPLARISWPLLSAFAGLLGPAPSFVAGVLTCWGFAALTIGVSLTISVRALQGGLQRSDDRAQLGPNRRSKTRSVFAKHAMQRKELLWLLRDRGAIVQVILVPLGIVGFQFLNIQRVLPNAQSEWNYLCGAAIVFGTNVLWVLGPRSLTSEGSALWIALTWPYGLDDLLRAKAWLWARLSSVVVILILAYAGFRFPHELWKVALVGVGWFLFARSMAEKAVTLVTVPSESGEPSKIPSSRRWAASLGMLTFSIGIITAQWQLAIVGIVFSTITAAAMWQNLRARLPFLYDPWSERLPPAPSLMHAMIAISVLIDGAAVIAIPVLTLLGRQSLGLLQPIAYTVSGAIVYFGAASFLAARGVTFSDVWLWGHGRRAGKVRYFLYTVALGAVGGVALGFAARAYVLAVAHIPAAADALRQAQEALAHDPLLRISTAVMAVGVAPFVEEYLFRGLLFRALDREWGGWRAVVGSAAFFAIYHPVLSWLPVFVVGMANALLFKRTGRLAAPVALHAIYNLVVSL